MIDSIALYVITECWWMHVDTHYCVRTYTLFLMPLGHCIWFQIHGCLHSRHSPTCKAQVLPYLPFEVMKLDCVELWNAHKSNVCILPFMKWIWPFYLDISILSNTTNNTLSCSPCKVHLKREDWSSYYKNTNKAWKRHLQWLKSCRHSTQSQ